MHSPQQAAQVLEINKKVTYALCRRGPLRRPTLQSIVTTSFFTGWLDLLRATSVAHSSALSTRHLGLRRDTYYVAPKQRGTRPFSALVPGRRVAFGSWRLR